MKIRCDSKLLTATVLVMSAFAAPSVFGQTVLEGTTMGPIKYQIVIHDKIGESAELKSGVQKTLDQVNQLMSTYIDTSDVSRVNHAEADQWIEVDVLTLAVIRKSLEFSELTSGAFDITVGPAVNAWKFGAETSSNAIPDTRLTEEIKEFVGYQNIEFRRDPPSVRKRNDRTQIDLSAIAKGFAVDHVAEFLADEGLKNFMVEVGGEVVVRGNSNSGNWRIGIEKPDETKRTVSTVVSLLDQALATSGDYRNFRIIAGKRISHTIDPVTCRPVENNIASCSVVADDCMTADAIATAVMVMGAEKGLKFCKENSLQASITSRTHDPKQRFVTTHTDGFPTAESAPARESATDKKSIWPAFLGAFVVFGIAVAGMAVGAIFNNRPISGSCGGIAGIKNEDGSTSCTICETPVEDCVEEAQETQEA